MSYRLGIDVGGTNTDAVIIDSDLNVMAKAKYPTSEDVSTGIKKVMDMVLNEVDISPAEINYAMLGTTHCTNAIVERKNLNKVAVIRLGKPATLAVKPLVGWPKDLRKAIGDYRYIVSGGHEFDGRKITELNKEELIEIAKEIKGKVSSIAITSVFSPVNNEFELQAREILKEELGDMNFSLSHEIGSMGLIERENATVLNAAVVNVAKKAATSFEQALKSHGINATKYFGQNDGTLMTISYAIKYPILTIACGPTNSIRGAVFLAGIKNGLVVDVGGTTTDIGVINNGFPRESAVAVEIGGVRTNFRMPDLLSIGLGGGTVIKGKSSNFSIGPESVGYKITEKSLVFGGDTITATDIAVSQGNVNLGDKEAVNNLDSDFCSKVKKKMNIMVEEGIDKMKTDPSPVPVIFVGGGSVLFNEQIKGAEKILKPENFDVANAIGAAISQVSGEIERIFSLENMDREEAINKAKEMAKDEAIKAGAEADSLEIVDVEDIPLAYLPGNATKIRVKAAGKLNE